MIIMPTPDAATIARRSQIAADLRRIIPRANVIESERERQVYESDALSAYRQPPLLVALPETVAQVAEILRYCQHHAIKIVPRGGGTSLSGGSLPLADGILLAMGKFNRILEIDEANRCAVVQPGVTNLGISTAVAHLGLYYAPDPSSQLACSIGGNVAENSGGIHCLKYGLTTNNILGIEMVLMDGSVVRLGGKHLDSGGYDLLGLMTGSEGLLGIVTEVTVRLLAKPAAARAMLIGLPSMEQAGACVGAVLSAGIIPAGMELLDQISVQAIERYAKIGYPLTVAAMMIVELDGTAAEVDHLVAAVEDIATAHGASYFRKSESEEERIAFWYGRKAAFAALGQLAPDYYCMDGSVPRHSLPVVLSRMKLLADQYGLLVANVFHAGDGNLHPLILFDATIPEQLEQAEILGGEILKLCVDVGGVLTGEHGVGMEKRDLMSYQFSEIELAQQTRLKCAFDPLNLLNPGKVFPELARCAEFGKEHFHLGKPQKFPELERF